MSPILQMLRSRVLPWIKSDERHIVLARSVMYQANLPSGALLEHRPLQEKKVPVINRRHFANQRLFSAEWPQSNQHEMLLPKIICVVNGHTDYLLGDYCLHAGEGTFILIPPNIPHHRSGPFLEGERLKNGECTLLFAYAYSHGIHFWFSHSKGEKHENNKANNYLIPNMASVQILHLLMDEAITNEPEWGTICQGLFLTFYSMIVRDLEKGRYMKPVKEERKEVRSLSDEDFAGRVREYIRANLYKRLKVSDAARHVYMSESHFSRTLRQKTGQSFGELLTEYRIERAKEMLISSDWTAAYIAGYIGLKSVAYFHEFFQHHVGCTPLEYRHKYQKQE